MRIKNISILIIIIFLFESGFSQQLVPYRKKNKWGYANRKGELIIKPQYKVAYPFITNITAVKKCKKYGFINRTGNPVTKFEFIRVRNFNNGQATVWTKNTSYCIDPSGKKIRGMAFCGTVNSPLEHFQTYTKNGKKGLINYAYFIDSPNRDSLPTVWEEVKTNDLYAAVKQVNKWGVVNATGDLTTELIYDSIELKGDRCYRQFFKVKKDNKYGFLNEKGVEIISPKYVKADFFNNGLAKVWISDKFWFYIDKTGREYYEK